MDRIHTTLLITGLCAVIVGWQLWRSAHEPPTLPSPAAPGSTGSAAAAQSLKPSAVQSSAAGPIEIRAPGADDPDCYVDQIVIHPETGEPEEAIACASDRAQHPYEAWSESVLAGMAYGDPAAAEVLGLRHIRSADPNREALGLMLLYRAVALSAETAVIHRAISSRYAVVSEAGKPNVHNLKQLLVFAIVASRLGDDGFRPATIEARLAKADVDAGEISRLKTAAERILEEMAGIEAEVTGNTTIREVLANA